MSKHHTSKWYNAGLLLLRCYWMLAALVDKKAPERDSTHTIFSMKIDGRTCGVWWKDEYPVYFQSSFHQKLKAFHCFSLDAIYSICCALIPEVPDLFQSKRAHMSGLPFNYLPHRQGGHDVTSIKGSKLLEISAYIDQPVWRVFGTPCFRVKGLRKSSLPFGEKRVVPPDPMEDFHFRWMSRKICEDFEFQWFWSPWKRIYVWASKNEESFAFESVSMSRFGSFEVKPISRVISFVTHEIIDESVSARCTMLTGLSGRTDGFDELFSKSCLDF